MEKQLVSVLASQMPCSKRRSCHSAEAMDQSSCLDLIKEVVV